LKLQKFAILTDKWKFGRLATSKWQMLSANANATHDCRSVQRKNSRKSRKHGSRDFRQMPWFCQNAVFFSQNTVTLCFLQKFFIFISIR